MSLENQTKKWLDLQKLIYTKLQIELFVKKKVLKESDGKGCANSKQGCIRKRKNGWVILNNKKGGVWRECDSRNDCEEQLKAFHANK